MSNLLTSRQAEELYVLPTRDSKLLADGLLTATSRSSPTSMPPATPKAPKPSAMS